MKYLVSAVVFTLLFIVPAGSWYYLQSGLDYRKDALKLLEPKGVFAMDGIDAQVLKSKTTLMQLQDVEEEILNDVFEQYRNSQTYQVITTHQPMEPSEKWMVIDADLAAQISAAYDNAGFILVDTSMMIRNTYPANMEGVRQMIEHTSIVLPRVKEMDIKMKNNG